jgi:hypothetical protein
MLLGVIASHLGSTTLLEETYMSTLRQYGMTGSLS